MNQKNYHLKIYFPKSTCSVVTLDQAKYYGIQLYVETLGR